MLWAQSASTAVEQSPLSLSSLTELLPFAQMSAPHPPSATGVVFSTSRLETNEASKDQYDEKKGNQTTVAVSSAKGSPAGSIHDSEKAEGTLEDDEKALSAYLVPALAKGQKNARLKPPSPWIKFRVWYNPYRMVSVVHFQPSEILLNNSIL